MFIIGLVWLSLGCYWYCVNDEASSYGAFISSIIFFVSCIIAKIWESYLNSNHSKENILAEIVAKSQPLAAMASKEFMGFIKKRGIITVLSGGLIIMTLYKIFIRKIRLNNRPSVSLK